MRTYKILVRFDATDEKDAEDFVYDMQPKDWLQHLEEEELCLNKITMFL